MKYENTKIAPAERSIVCLACEDYWYHPKRSRRHLMEGLARRGWRVLFVNSIGMRAPSREHPDFWMRVRRKMRSWARWVRRPDTENLPTFWVASPIALPFFDRPWAVRFNKALLPLQIKLMMKRAGIRNPILWVGNPAMADLKGKVRESLCVLHASDRYDAYQEIRGNVISENLERLAREADLVVSASRMLRDEFGEVNAHSIHLPHGVDAAHFSRARRDPDLRIPEDLAKIPRPRLGFVGSVDQVLDHELIAHVAEQEPSWHQVFVGHYSREVDWLKEKYPKNIHFLGARPYEEVPAYLKGFDVGIMPWRSDEWIRHCNPLKLKEYLLAARPSVTTPFAEVEAYRNQPLLHIAGPEAEVYLEGIRAALAQSDRLLDARSGLPLDTDEMQRAEKEISELEIGTWESRAAEIEDLFSRHSGNFRAAAETPQVGVR